MNRGRLIVNHAWLKRPTAVACAFFFLFVSMGCGLTGLPAKETSQAAVSLERQTAEGPVIGVEDPSTPTVSWKAIPYAKAPVGALRWRAPQPPEKRVSPLRADKFCDLCPQYIDHDRNPATPQIIVGKEDCLYLNIWAPKNALGKLPVFFWIHGGGNSIQWPLLSLLDGGALSARGNMIVVTFNYRLGPMGFFSHPALQTGDPAGDSGNFTILDIIAALKWVQANIHQFGGDPNNVTIAGESAGGQNVICLVSSPMARGLFHRAISQSGVIRPSTPAQGEAHVYNIAAKLLVKDGKAADIPAATALLAAMSDSDLNTYMRSKSAADFLEMYPEGKKMGMIFFPTAYGDGKVLPSNFYATMKSGHYNKVPMILGTNKEETKLFLRSIPPFADWRQDGSLLTDPAKTDLFNLVAAYQSDGWKVMAVDNLARILTAHADQPPVFAYQFLWGAGGAKNPVIDPPLNILLGACHAMEIDFVFGTEKASLGALVFNEKNRPGRVALSHAMMDYWSQFARSGNPNKEGSGFPQWLRWSNAPDGPKTMALDADREKATFTMGRLELTNEAIEAALKAEPRQKDIQPFWDQSLYRIR
jgi:para-nitrobenzyl esterase